MRVSGAALALALLAPGCAREAPAPAAAPAAVRIVVPYELASIDPQAENTLSSYAILSNVYEPLVTMDADLAVKPALAETWESPDALTWIFRLRADVAFHSGRPLTVDDVVYSVQRLLQDPALGMRSYVRDVVEVGARDARTVLIRTARPARILLSKLRFVLVVPRGATAASLAATPDGTGPFALVAWRPGQDVHLRAHEAYWGGRPALSEATYVTGAPAGAALGAGLVQLESRAAEEPFRASGRYDILRRESLYVKYLGYDLARDVTPYCRAVPNPFRKLAVRQALEAAIDRPALAARLSHRGVPASQPVPRFVFGFDPTLAAPPPDPARARSLLAEAGLPGGFEVTLHARRLFADPAEIVRTQLGAVGVRVSLRVVSDPDFFEAVSRRDASFWLSRWGCATGDASDILEPYVHSTDRLRQLGQNNYSGYANPELDEAIDESAGIESPALRRVALQRIVRRVTGELVLLPLYNDEDVFALARPYRWRPRSDSYVRAAEITLDRR